MVAQQLAACGLRVVFAESCTAGLVSATLATVPGISEFLCGAAVTYREATKIAWLDVSPASLQTYSAVSEPVTNQMALGILERTAEADLAVAVTGHLGPQAPAELDGRVFIAVARRTPEGLALVSTTSPRLTANDRLARQHEAVRLVLAALGQVLGAQS